jgi:Taurine catabolism dioxygenase TauD, TfdA family
VESLARPFRDVLASVLRGRGFAVLRGIPVERWGLAATEAFLVDLFGRFGSLVPQNAKGDLLAHVSDRGVDPTAPQARGYLTRSRLSFHSDPGGDVVGLLCVRKARQGGGSAIVSSMTIYNELLENHPEYLGLLYSGFVHDRRMEQRSGDSPVSPRIPIFSCHRGDLSCRYTRAYIASGQQKVGFPLGDVELAMFDFIDSVAADVRNHWSFELEPGDLLLCNSHTTLHSRTGYEDGDDPDRKRLMLRIWLAIPNARQLADRREYWYA